jgi:hypothetical protein
MLGVVIFLFFFLYKRVVFKERESLCSLYRLVRL